MVFAPGGLEEREAGDAIEYVLYGAAGELPALGDVRAAVGGELVDVSTTELPDDWGQDWRSFHRADRRSPGLRVRPALGAAASTGALDVVIEPGQAFGTGSHATTRLTLELLAELEPEGALADWGCGSGVLAIAAAKLGWSPVLACDVEPESVVADPRRRRGQRRDGRRHALRRAPWRPARADGPRQPRPPAAARGRREPPARPRPADHLRPRRRRARRGRRRPSPATASHETPPPRGRRLVRRRAPAPLRIAPRDHDRRCARRGGAARRGRAPHAGHHRPHARRGRPAPRACC